MSRNIVLIDPLPRTLELIMEPGVRARLEQLGELVISEDRQMPDDQVDALLPETVLIFGQTAMPKERLDRAPKLKAIIIIPKRPAAPQKVGAASDKSLTLAE